MPNPDVLFFFDQKPEALALYQAFEQRVRACVPDVRIRVQKTQITFANRHNFAAVSFLPVRKAKQRPAQFITVTFGLDHPLASPRIDAAVEPYPHRWTHHVLVASPAELDDELLGWVQQAAAFSAQKR